MQATLTFLGTGTSMGVPTLGCDCAVCLSAVTPASEGGDPHNRRSRASVRIAYDGHTVLIDTGADFYAQAIREGIRRIDAVFYTHPHADHILGLDDLRPLSFHHPVALPLYADPQTADKIEEIFEYNFRADNKYPTRARVAVNRLDTTPGTAVELFGAKFERIPVQHGRLTITGYRFGAAAYLTDMSDIPDESLALLKDLDILILDALRHEPHYSHSHIAKSLELVDRIQPKRAFFTHMGHTLDHATTDASLPPHVRLAYDGLQLNFEIAPDNA